MEKAKRPFTKSIKVIMWFSLGIAGLMLETMHLESTNSDAWLVGLNIVLIVLAIRGISSNPVSVWPLQLVGVCVMFYAPIVGPLVGIFLIYGSFHVLKEKHFYKGVRQPDSIGHLEMSASIWSEKKLKIFWSLVGVSPLLSWALIPAFGAFGCSGNEGVGIRCEKVLGINVDAMFTILYLYMAWGILISAIGGMLAYLLGMKSLKIRRELIEIANAGEGAANPSLQARLP